MTIRLDWEGMSPTMRKWEWDSITRQNQFLSPASEGISAEWDGEELEGHREHRFDFESLTYTRIVALDMTCEVVDKGEKCSEPALYCWRCNGCCADCTTVEWNCQKHWDEFNLSFDDFMSL